MSAERSVATETTSKRVIGVSTKPLKVDQTCHWEALDAQYANYLSLRKELQQAQQHLGEPQGNIVDVGEDVAMIVPPSPESKKNSPKIPKKRRMPTFQTVEDKAEYARAQEDAELLLKEMADMVRVIMIIAILIY